MIAEFLEHIATKLHMENPYFNVAAVNCIKLSDGKVIKDWETGSEMNYKGLTETLGFYIRFNGEIEYEECEPRNSFATQQKTVIPCRLVAFQVADPLTISPSKLLYKLSEDLKHIDFSDFDYNYKSGMKVDLLKSNHNPIEVFEEEIGAKKGPKSPLVMIAIDFNAQFEAFYFDCKTSSYVYN